MRDSRRPRQYLAETSNASTGDLADRRSRHAVKPASASSFAISSIFRPALVAPSRAWINWLFTSVEALCAALLICSKPSAALRTPICVKSRTRSPAALVVSVACSIAVSRAILVVVMVVPWLSVLSGYSLMTGRIWDRYGALQHELLRCENISEKLMYFN